MTKNAILSELYEIRSRILAEHSADLRNHLDGELQRLKSQGHLIALIKQRTIRCTRAAKQAVSTLESQP